jgi:hypothetical protein
MKTKDRHGRSGGRAGMFLKRKAVIHANPEYN